MEDVIPEATDDHLAWLRPAWQAEWRRQRRQKLWALARNILICLGLLAAFTAGVLSRGPLP